MLHVFRWHSAISRNLHDGGLELQVLFDCTSEDLDGNFLVQRGANDSQERLELILLILGTLSSDQVESYVVLRILGQVHVFHSCVSHIDLVLEWALFLGDVTDEYGHLSENDSIIEDETNEHHEDVDNLNCRTRSHFITTEGKDSHIKNYHVLVPIVDFFEIIESIVAATLYIDEVKRRHPPLLNRDNCIPDATDDVHN